jgi:hypothetical protein
LEISTQTNQTGKLQLDERIESSAPCVRVLLIVALELPNAIFCFDCKLEWNLHQQPRERSDSDVKAIPDSTAMRKQNADVFRFFGSTGKAFQNQKYLDLNSVRSSE